jgi:hypothetical protein
MLRCSISAVPSATVDVSPAHSLRPLQLKLRLAQGLLIDTVSGHAPVR